MSDINPYDQLFHTIPERREDAPSGSVFSASVRNMPLGPARETAFLDQLTAGNVPDFMRKPRNLSIAAGDNSITYSVLPDYLCIGTDDDYFRVPLNPRTAQKVADVFGCTLPTRKMVDQIWKDSDIKLPPSPLPPGAKMTTVPYFEQHNDVVQTQLQKKVAELGLLVGGHKKDVVISNTLLQFPNNVVIYGWHQLNGTVIQGQNPKSHDNHYADYSHGIRMVLNTVLLNGEVADIRDVWGNAKLASLLSDEGQLKVTRYP